MASGIKVSGLFIYPIKSCKGIPVERAALAPQGLLHDRMIMLVDEKGKFLSQRKAPRMALIEVDVDAALLMRPEKLECILRAPGMDAFPLRWERDAYDAYKPHSVAQIWKDQVHTEDMGDAAAEWFAMFLGISGCRLVRLREDWNRTLEDGFVENPAAHVVSLADGYPLLLTSEESMKDLNEKIPAGTPGRPLHMDRFRPNVVVCGLERAWQEDGWRRIRIGADVVFQVPKPCARCKLPNTDQTTAMVGTEPLKTLLKERKFGAEVMFGQNLVHETNAGILEVGAMVEILEEVSP
ncbi:protein YcbX [Porphyridium purpureum]|uniref:Protein YcbX n=1 Tax=Porphyridium purpureum TaxID=35688 RepID=A0A5J4Z508_PORPP|nr:protein YcbX [Porphyridium purpureum]|eukprot:POR9901..scf295_1